MFEVNSGTWVVTVTGGTKAFTLYLWANAGGTQECWASADTDAIPLKGTQISMARQATNQPNRVAFLTWACNQAGVSTINVWDQSSTFASSTFQKPTAAQSKLGQVNSGTWQVRVAAAGGNPAYVAYVWSRDNMTAETWASNVQGCLPLKGETTMTPVPGAPTFSNVGEFSNWAWQQFGSSDTIYVCDQTSSYGPEQPYNG
jgi:hypothetical protein